VKEALTKLNMLGYDAILFVTADKNRLVGSLTDGDIRRGFLKGYEFNTSLIEFCQPSPVFIEQGKYSVSDLDNYRERNLKIIPILDAEGHVIEILNFRLQRSLLPLDAIIMAGGEGRRLRPLTEHTPKPLLKIGGKPIIEHCIDRLKLYGVKNIYISVKYLGQQLVDYLGDGASKELNIRYIWEEEPLGTIGALSLIDHSLADNVLVMNSDILTNINFEDFYRDHKEKGADMSVASIPYKINIPYAVLETNGHTILSFEEKPTYTYYSNGGIYLLNKEIINSIPKAQKYNATDLMTDVIQRGMKLVNYPLLDYWLDIGRHEDYERAQEDFKHFKP
jgi:dTDP-glucose pyrophosphorylase